MKDDRLEFMKNIAYQAGDNIMDFWDTDVRSRFKDDKSIVTEADMRSSELVQREIAKRFPNDGILNEKVEGSLDRLTKSGVWIVDHLDGSGDFKRKEAVRNNSNYRNQSHFVEVAIKKMIGGK